MILFQFLTLAYTHYILGTRGIYRYNVHVDYFKGKIQ